MSARDGFLFQLGRIGAEVALFLGLVVVIALIFAVAHHAPRLWWRVRGTPCGAQSWRRREFGPCVLTKGHDGHHANAWERGDDGQRSRLRWWEGDHGSASHREWATAADAAGEGHRG